MPSNFLPSSAVSQFPTRTPNRRTPFMRRMPAARSELRSPQSDASYASRRIAASLRLIVDGAYGRCSRAILYLVTTVLLNARRGSEQYQSMNSQMAWSYERFELGDVRLFRTADFDCSRSGSLRTVFETRFRRFFSIRCGLQRRIAQHVPEVGCALQDCPSKTDFMVMRSSEDWKLYRQSQLDRIVWGMNQILPSTQVP